MENQPEGLRREIGTWGLSANMINAIVGAGIFVLPAVVAEGLGAASILAYLFCGFLVALVMLCFAEAGSKVTTSGGAYAFIETAFGRYPGFLTSMLSIAGTIASDAAIANALAGLAGSVWAVFRETWVRVPLFFILFSGMAWVNIIGVKQGIGLVKLTTVAKLIPPVLVILFCWKEFNLSNLRWETAPTLKSLGEMSIVLFFAFKGGESALTVGGEVRNPQRTVPKAILISISAVLLLYVLVQTVAQGVLGNMLPQMKESPIAEVARQIAGPFGFTLITIGAAISMFGCVSGDILSSPRILYGTARDRVIPVAWLAKVHPKYATPYTSILLYTSLAFIVASVGGFRQLAVLSGTAGLLIYIGVALAVMKLRKSGSTPGSFRIPGGFTVPIAAILVIVWLLSNLAPKEMIWTVAFIGILTAMYFLIRIRWIRR